MILFTNTLSISLEGYIYFVIEKKVKANYNVLKPFELSQYEHDKCPYWSRTPSQIVFYLNVINTDHPKLNASFFFCPQINPSSPKSIFIRAIIISSIRKGLLDIYLHSNNSRLHYDFKLIYKTFFMPPLPIRKK